MLLLIKVLKPKLGLAADKTDNNINISPCDVMLRGAEVSRSSAVAGDIDPPHGGRAELCRAAADHGSSYCGRNAGGCGKTHRFPVFCWNIT